MGKAEPYVLPTVLRSTNYNVAAFRNFLANNKLGAADLVARRNVQSPQVNNPVVNNPPQTQTNAQTAQ